MSAPVFAAAQCVVTAGDIDTNLALHLQFMQQARQHDAQLLIFPELS